MQDFIGSHVAISAVGLYVIWLGLTYLLEGRLLTLRRPEARGQRAVYAIVVNILVGIVLSGWLLAVLADAGAIRPHRAGFQEGIRIAFSVIAAAGLGLAFFRLQRPPSRHPMVVLNGFAQVWTVSAAEIMVCWAVVGAVTEDLLQDRGDVLSMIAAALVASALFGVYHIGHSPPFNRPGMILKLTGIGLLTSLFFFVSRDIYGTIVFHNVFALFGVLRALQGAGKLAEFERLSMPLLATAGVSLVTLIAVHLIWL